MNSGSAKNKISRIPLLRKNGMVIFGIFYLFFAGFIFSQNLPLEEGQVYVCPLATKMEEINPKCDCRIDLILGETVTFTCPVDGKTYEMRLTITEYEGKEYFAILGFENGGAGVNFKPKAKISAPSEGSVDKEILFDAFSSFDPNEDPLDFFWDFGDGNFKKGEKVFHSFSSPGEYLITLTVSDGMFSDSATKTIKISPTSIFTPKTFGKLKKEKEEISEKEHKEKGEIKEEEEIKEEQIKEERPKEISQAKENKPYFSLPKEPTKILKKEKPKEEIEKKEKSFSSQEKEISQTKIFPQIFTSFVLASLKETLTSFPVLLLLFFSILASLLFILKKIRRSKKI